MPAASPRRPENETHPEFDLEAAHLDGTVAAMLRQIEFWEDRERNAGADLETSVIMADEAGEHAAMLSPHVHHPYFGSLKVRVGGREQTLYVGKHAFQDVKGPHHVVGWDSEVGSLFYTHELTWTPRRGGKGTIRRRRQLDVMQKRLLRVTDLYDDEQGGDTGGREEVLLRRLNEGSTAGMRDVVETLQPEQNEAMRFPAGTPVIIQGAAGSGKTTIGFHRLAWMTNAERGVHRARPEACMVLMPNRVLAAYAGRILPELGLEGVNVTTPESWAVGLLGLEKLEVTDRTLTLLLTDRDNTRRALAWRRAKLLGDARMLDVVRTHLWHKWVGALRGQALSEALEVPGRGLLTFSLDEAALLEILRTVFAQDSLDGYRAAFRRVVEELALDTLRVPEEHQAGVLRQLSTPLTTLLGRVFASTTPVTETRRLLGSPEALKASSLLTEREIQLLQTDPLSGIPTPRRAHADVTELPLMLAMQAFMGGIGRTVGRTLEPFDHVVLDEAQDYSPLLYTLLGRATREGHLTALGDMNQGMHGYKGPNTWDAVRGVLPGAQTLTLSRTYRSTRQITELGARIASTYNRAADVQGVDRDGAEVQRYQNGNELELIARAVKDAQSAGHTNIAIVTRRGLDAERLSEALRDHDTDAQPITTQEHRFKGGLVILPVNLAKGLEFSAAIVASADTGTYDDSTEYERRLLYVSASRALHWLALVSAGELHPLIA
ncbi:ATP-binding domain-containing protein [Deinococcus deserti]|uniref:Putative uvrD/rep helicase family protein n=1 Tax=Deinococcus deserti (strain DSM 17065 / CIP 109153 / LMG 22923 / VCD115) TaxID=546414 RepID=C1CX02_DEIDV|nr:ATP-binding domain-containing protein [Deinococcus deserti]ACO46719.2 putative uvrD/rep helicase family protein [Deinococcus deserti VCD115]